MSRARDIADGTLNSADINGGNIDNTTIGGTNPAAGSFTTITSTGSVGVGTSSPSTLLEVADGDITVSESDATLSSSLNLQNDSGTQLILRGAGSTRTNPGCATGMPQLVSLTGYDLYIGTDYQDDVVFTTDRTERMRIDSSGNVTLSGTANNIGTVTSGTFNGTIGDSITLSQGTWTPTFTNSAGSDLATSYGTRHATYTRIGNLVFFNVDISLSAYTNSSTSQLFLSGLPMFGVSPSATNIQNNGYPGGIVSYFDVVDSLFAVSYSIHWVFQNTGRINFYYANGTTSSFFQQKWLTSSSRFIFEGKYYLAEIT